MNKLGFCVLR